MRRYRRCGAALLAAASCLCLASVPGLAADTGAGGQTGDPAHYNGIVFDYFESAQGNVEGALAVGGESKIGTSGQFDFGAASVHAMIGRYENPHGFPTLLLGGAPRIGRPGGGGGNVQVYGGPATLSEGLRTGYESGPGFSGSEVRYAGDTVVDGFFESAYSRVSTAVHAMQIANSQPGSQIRLSGFNGWNGGYRQTFRDLTAFEPNNLHPGVVGATGALVINVQDQGIVRIDAPHIPSSFQDYDLVIFNFPHVDSVIFSGSSVLVDGVQINASAPSGTPGNELLRRYAERIIWNFPHARTVQVVGCGVVGSVLAPHAYVEANGGSVNGMLVAESFKTENGMGLHAFYMRRNIFDFVDPDPPTGSVVLYKYDRSDPWHGPLLLPGAEFLLYRADGAPVRAEPYVTDETGALRADGLPVGDYYFLETTPPYGYLQPAPPGDRLDFSITERHGIEQPREIAFPNRRIAVDLLLKKTDGESPAAPLPGARFELYLVNGRMLQLLGEYISDADGDIRLQGLDYGRYQLVEVGSPPGYLPGFGRYIGIVIAGDATGVHTVRYYDDTGALLQTDGTLRLQNAAAPGNDHRVVLSKTDFDRDDTPLEGAVFELYEHTAAGWQHTGQEYATDEFGHLYLALPTGVYKLAESAPPPGYALVESDREIVFDLPYTGTAEPESLSAALRRGASPARKAGGGTRPAWKPGGEPRLGPSVVDGTLYLHARNRALGRITVVKAGADSPAALRLQGAQFALYYDRGAGNASRWEHIETQETGPEGTVVFEHLRPGTYHVLEVRSPDSPGEAGEPVLVEPETPLVVGVGPDPVYVYEITAASPVRLAEMDIQKINGSTGQALAGASFDLLQYVGGAHDFQYYGAYQSGADGVIRIPDLPYGRYKIVEMKAPDGFAIDRQYDRHEVLFTISELTLAPGGYLDGYLTVENSPHTPAGSRPQGRRSAGGPNPLPEGDGNVAVEAAPEAANPDMGDNPYAWAAAALFATALLLGGCAVLMRKRR